MVLEQLACAQGRNDEQPNILLAQQLVEEQNIDSIKEIVENLANKNKKIANDCIKVAYEIGRLKPELISEYALTFIHLLNSRNNRLVWGAMQTLSTIAPICSDLLMEHLNTIISAINNGSVITVDKGILTLGKLASINKENNERIVPYLLKHLATCRTKEVPQHAESSLPAVTEENKADFIKVLQKREPYFTKHQKNRVYRIYRELGLEN